MRRLAARSACCCCCCCCPPSADMLECGRFCASVAVAVLRLLPPEGAAASDTGLPASVSANVRTTLGASSPGLAGAGAAPCGPACSVPAATCCAAAWSSAAGAAGAAGSL